MADAYRTKGDVSLPRVLSVEGEGDNALVNTESVLYPAGSYVLAEDMTPRDQKRAANGDLDHLLDPADVNEARQAIEHGGVGEDFGIFVPEHEAEAHALEVYGHAVVPKEQALELSSKSGQWAAEYQEAVREHGLDRRPVQEALAQQRQRIPEELLAGGQTRSGLPHDRGPVGYASPDEAEDQQDRAEAQVSGGKQVEAQVAAASNAPRQRPGSQASGPQESEQQPQGSAPSEAQGDPNPNQGQAQPTTPTQAQSAPPTPPTQGQ